MISYSKFTILWRVLVVLAFLVVISISLVTLVQARDAIPSFDHTVLKETTKAQGKVSGETKVIEAAGTSSWQEMLDYEATQPTQPQPQKIAPYMHPAELRELSATDGFTLEKPSSAPIPLDSPTTLDNFAGLGDNNVSIPPDTMGAAGPKHLMIMLNTQVRIQDKTGINLSTVTLDTFWTIGTGLSGDPFDPRIVFDTLSNRWMAIVVADTQLASSATWLAISDTDDPTGDWTFYGIDADAGNSLWADFPDVGVNSTWIAITNNMFTIASDTFIGTAMWVIDKSTALSGGPLTVTTFTAGFDAVGGGDGRSLRPALTFDPDESTLYIVDGNRWFTIDLGIGILRLSQITGTGPSPAWSVVTNDSVEPGSGFFTTNLTYNVNQIDADQPGTTTDVRTNDSRLQNAVFRDGRLWTTHSAGYPRSSTADRTVIAWYELDPAASPNPIVQSGIIDGGSGVHHFFPSIAVNANNDMAIGFSRSSASLFVEGVYTGRESTDPAGTVGAIQVCKAGEDSYTKDFFTGNVRWGDYSATVVDPTDDTTFWTLQEYAETDVGPTPNDDRWGTWWCRTGWNSLGDYVWYDGNQNGIQDGDETGISDVIVNLYSSNDALSDTTTTDSAGFYSFNNLNPGDYYLEFIPPIEHIFTIQNEGADDTLDSDADPLSGQTIPITIGATTIDSTWDAGLYKPVFVDKLLDQPEDEYRVGDDITYNILIRNDSPFTITAMSLTDTFDTSVIDYLDTVPAPDSVNFTAGTLGWDDLSTQFGELSPGESIEITVGFTAVSAADTVNNTVDLQDIMSSAGTFPDVSDTNSEAQIIAYTINLPVVLKNLNGLR